MAAIEWHVVTDFAWDGVKLYAGNEREHVTAVFSKHEHEPGAWVEPTMRLTPDEAQQIMNGLWRAGIRPRDGAGALAHVSAQQSHLEDLRKIAFHALNIEK